MKITQKHNGTYIPPQIIKCIPVRGSADNVDMRVDTPDGRGTFHGTADTIMMIHALEIVQTNKENVVEFFYTRHRLVGANPSSTS